MRKTVCSPKLETLDSRQLLSTAKPTFDVWAISPTQVELSLVPVKGDTGYLVQEPITLYKFEKIRGHKGLVAVPTVEWETIAQLGKNATNYAINGLTPSTTYTIDLVGLKGRTQHKGAPEVVTTLCPAPVAPQWNACSIESTSVTLQWGSVPGATNYTVYGYIGVTGKQSPPSVLAPHTT